MSDTHNKTPFWKLVWEYITKGLRKDLLVEETVNDIIGTNAKVVIFTLFGLILASIIFYTVLITGKYNPESTFSGIKTDMMGFDSLEEAAYNEILNDNSKSATVKLQLINKLTQDRMTEFQDRFKAIEQIDTVFIAAITGAVALGGTLITQLWARRQL